MAQGGCAKASQSCNSTESPTNILYNKHSRISFAASWGWAVGLLLAEVVKAPSENFRLGGAPYCYCTLQALTTLN